MPEIPDLTDHPGTEGVHFGERSGIPGVHYPPAAAAAKRRAASHAAKPLKPADASAKKPDTTLPTESPVATTTEED